MFKYHEKQMPNSVEMEKCLYFYLFMCYGTICIQNRRGILPKTLQMAAMLRAIESGMRNIKI